LILVRLNMTAKTHRGVQRLFSKLANDDPQLADLALFLSQSYNLKAVADYELGPGAGVPLDRARAAIETAAQFTDRVAAILG
jgi:uncharacterized protein (UPF0332 family)